MTFSCPTCGQAVSERPSPAVLVATTPLSPLEMKIVQALLPEFGQFIPRARLRNAIFGGHSRMTQLKRDRSLASSLTHVNQKLSARGLIVEFVRGDKQRTSHRLTWIVEQLVCENCGAIYPANAKYRMCTCGGRLAPMPLTTESQAA